MRICESDETRRQIANIFVGVARAGEASGAPTTARSKCRSLTPKGGFGMTAVFFWVTCEVVSGRGIAAIAFISPAKWNG